MAEYTSLLPNEVKDQIDSHSHRAHEMRRLYRAYKGHTPIKHRNDIEGKLNNKISNDYRGDIIDTITGYLFGNPISYDIDSQGFTSEEDPMLLKAKETLSDWYVRNSIDSLDSETGKYMSICGTASRLQYIQAGTGHERIMNIPPWETIFIYDQSLDGLQYAIRYYTMMVQEKGEFVPRVKAEVYDSMNITYFMEQANGRYIEIDQQPHLFDAIPLTEFPNNEERMGDFEKVESLIDAYDRLMSDAQNEIEEQRLAYMKVTGAVMDRESILAARQTGVFNLPDKDCDVQFIEKQINDTFLENQKATLNENIYKFSKSVDMSDEKFSGGTQSGESRKWKLLGLENKAITKERKFNKALREQFRILATAWAKKGIQIDYLDLYTTWRRNIPVELSYEADILAQLKGKISDKTLFSKLSIVDDPEWEMQQMKMEGMNPQEPPITE